MKIYNLNLWELYDNSFLFNVCNKSEDLKAQFPYLPSNAYFLSLLLPFNKSLLYSLKLCLSLLFLLLMRGGTPRYRYDYLTKLGWLKFLNFSLLTIISSFILILLTNAV